MSSPRLTGVLVFVGGVCGALGIALSAASAHYPGGTNLNAAAEFLLLHGPVFFALAALAQTGALPRWSILVGAVVLVIGLGLFSGDLARRVLAGERLFHWAAPAGGALLILGWVWFSLTGIFLLVGSRKPAKTD